MFLGRDTGCKIALSVASGRLLAWYLPPVLRGAGVPNRSRSGETLGDTGCHERRVEFGGFLRVRAAREIKARTGESILEQPESLAGPGSLSRFSGPRS
jgi:hypothetical protein